MDSFTVASFLHILLRVLLIGGLVTFVMAAGEWALEFNIKKAVKSIVAGANIYVETKGDKGSLWPLVVFMLGIPAICAYILG